MATTTHYFSGPVSWAKLRQDNLDTYNADDPKSKITLSMNKEDYDRLKSTGSRLRPKINDEGMYDITFSRRFNADDNGGLPDVIDANGNPFDGLVGNGSKCTIKFVVYDTRLGKATRLEAVRVDELVEYDAQSKYPEDMEGVPF